MKKLIIANWKMNPQTLTEAKQLFNSIKKGVKIFKNIEVIICLPFTQISNLKSKILNLKLGAQNCFWEKEGAFTGEISPMMLKNLGVKYVMIGHSERRRYLNETDEMNNKKTKAVLSAGLKVILCIGSAQKGKREKIEITRQLKKTLFEVKKSDLKNIIFVYEPVWAISATKGSTATSENAKQVALFIKKILSKLFNVLPKIKIIYGGSVNSNNVQGFIEKAKINGVLVGAASLDAKEFIQIAKKISFFV